MAWTSSAELLAAFRSECGLPSVNDEFPSDSSGDNRIYDYLSLAQQEVVREIASIAPRSQWPTSPEKLTTADGGFTYSFASYPFGHVDIRESRTGRLLVPGAEWDTSADYVPLGQTIRMTDNRQVTFTDGPYGFYAAIPPDISDSQEPTLEPSHARQLILWRALSKWAKKGGLRDPSPFDAEYQRIAWGDPRLPGDIGLVGALRVQYARTGGSQVNGISSQALWATQGGAGW